MPLTLRFVPVASLAICLHECINVHYFQSRDSLPKFVLLATDTDVVLTMYTKTTQNKTGNNINRS